MSMTSFRVQPPGSRLRNAGGTVLQSAGDRFL